MRLHGPFALRRDHAPAKSAIDKLQSARSVALRDAQGRQPFMAAAFRPSVGFRLAFGTNCCQEGKNTN